MDINDTILGIATPPGLGGIGIIRVSGPGALAVLKALFTPKGSRDAGGEPRARYLCYGTLKDARTGVVLDNANCVYFPAPASFTGEDVVEFHCHGGLLIMKNVLAAALSSGARMAEPGEFTRQAFVNSKMDLTQAEAVLDLIRAGTDSALIAALSRLDGRLSVKLKALREEVFTMLARIEAELDFSEEEIDKLTPSELLPAMGDVEIELNKLLDTYGEGSALRDGVKVAIIGRPNVGKSSLLNILLKEERAIVTGEPGTTRDVLEEVVNIRGIPVRLIDTAGLREAENEAESIGVNLARERAIEARLVLFVVDASDQASFKDDKEILDTLDRRGQKRIIVANKSDLINKKERKEVEEAFKENFSPVFISAKKEEGLEALEDAIYLAVTGHARVSPDDTIDGTESISRMALGETITSARHKGALEEALKAVRGARKAESEGMPMEIVALELRGALDSIGLVTGETTTEDILERIFSEFCIGK